MNFIINYKILKESLNKNTSNIVYIIQQPSNTTFIHIQNQKLIKAAAFIKIIKEIEDKIKYLCLQNINKLKF